jgi:XRE family aerobic/anaerobic benzoate catabolism transcriptional regulator
MRPMADNRESMADLRRILTGREPLYGKADLQLSTTDRTPGQCAELLGAQLPAPVGRGQNLHDSA